MYVRVLASVLSLLIYSGIANAAPFAYIANNNDNTVTVLDTVDNSVAATVTVGTKPYGVAVNRMGSRVYVSNEGTTGNADFSVSVIDTLDNSVTSFTPTLRPGALAVNSAGTRLFISHPNDASVSVYDTATLTQVGTTLDLDAASPVCTQPSGIVAGPADGSGNYNVYVSCFGSQKVGIITYTAATSTFAKSSTAVNLTNIIPQGITTSKDGKRVYVAGSSSVALINTTGTISSTPTATFTDASKLATATGIAADPSIADSATATKLYVTNMGSDKISVITATGDALSWNANIDSGSGPWGIAFTADGAKAVVSNNYSGDPGSASVITKSTNSLTTLTNTMGSAPKSFGKFAGPSFQTIYTSISSGMNCGSISPAMPITSPQGSGYYNDYQVAYGEPITFSITKDALCSIAAVTVNGSGQGTPTSYTFAAPTADQTLDVAFTRNSWNVALTKTNPGDGASGTLTVKLWTGSNWVTTGGLSCGASCSGSFADGTKIQVSGAADSNSVFEGMSGSNCNGTNVCEFYLNQTEAGLRNGTTGTFTINGDFSKKLSGPFRYGSTRGGTTSYASTLQEAYTSVADGGFIDLLADTDASITDLNSTLSANLSKTVTLVGGWVAWTDSAPTSGKSSKIVGGLTESYGSLIIGSVGNYGSVYLK